MKKKNYVSPTMEELRADEMHLLAHSHSEQNTGTGYDYEEGEGDKDPGRS